jgi:hypothetical protein
MKEVKNNQTIMKYYLIIFHKESIILCRHFVNQGQQLPIAIQ